MVGAVFRTHRCGEVVNAGEVSLINGLILYKRMFFVRKKLLKVNNALARDFEDFVRIEAQHVDGVVL